MVLLSLLLACTGEPKTDDPTSDDSAAPVDADGDGHTSDVDCDDANPSAFPGAPEACTDLVDLDCDGAISAVDEDGDGSVACEDCDDHDASAHPGGTEVCGGGDEDCDGVEGEDDAEEQDTWYADVDGDGYGAAEVTQLSCAQPTGFVFDDTDCDDGSAEVHPDATELADDGVDQDCDGGELCALDADHDGYSAGTVASADLDCLDDGESLGALPSGDCDDAAPEISPAAAELCNGVDDDCDGTVDIGVGDTWYADADGDGFGDTDGVLLACEQPDGYVADGTDCEDGSASAFPGGVEVCGDGFDGDCDADGTECRWYGDLSSDDADYWLGGSASGDHLGAAIALGDFDGDGAADLLAGLYAHGVSSFEGGEGSVALLYGPITSSGEALALADASWYGTRGAYIGSEVAAGDLDGDGVDDHLISAESGAGAVYVMYGGARRSGDDLLDSSAADAVIVGATGQDAAGDALGTGGDLDGDGIEDLAVGASGVSGSMGAVYLYLGASSRLSGSVTLASADGEIAATETGYFGEQVAVVEDMDGDGLAELLVGAPQDRSVGAQGGAAFLYLGDASALAGSLDTSDADLSLEGATASDYFGSGVYNLSDISGDGYADVGVCAPGYDAQTGVLWMYNGGTTVSAVSTGSAVGPSRNAELGCDSGSAGDLDDDGVADLMMGATGVDLGVVYHWYGPVATGSLDVATADGRLIGTSPSGDFGLLAREQADLTGDGSLDLLAAGEQDWVSENYAGGIFIWEGPGGM